MGAKGIYHDATPVLRTSYTGPLVRPSSGRSTVRRETDDVIDPGVLDDSTRGYLAGSTWRNTISGKVWHCRSASVGAADWVDLTASGGAPGGTGTEIQYRAGASFGAVAGSTWNGTTLTLPAVSVSGGTAGTTHHVSSERNFAGTDPRLRLVNEADVSQAGTSIEGYHWNGSQRYRTARIVFERAAAGANFGIMAFEVGLNNQWNRFATLSFNGWFTAVSVAGTTRCGAGETALYHSATGSTPTVSDLRHGWWGYQHLNMVGRASGIDAIQLDWRGFLGLHYAVAATPATPGTFAVNSRDAAYPVMVAQGHPAQTAPLHQWRTSAGTVVASVGPTGLVTSAGVALSDGADISVSAINGTKIGTTSGSKLAFWGATPTVQPAYIADAAEDLADVTAKLNTLLGQHRTIGLMAAA